jgi:predicted unusual protein kinase regulating ubiquinone biosynthesis (AarF/ABC1/UbiB family)
MGRQSEDEEIPTGRVQRTAKVGSVIGTSGAKYAGTRARNLVRSKEDAAEALDRSHLESAERMVEALGTMKGAAMKIGQLASFIDTEFLPPEYRELYQEKLSALRSEAPPMPWKTVKSVLEEEWDEPVEDLFEDFSQEAAAAASIGQVHRAVMPDGREVAVKVQYPGVAKALRADMQNAGMIMRLAKALAPGLDAKAAAEELKQRVLEELDYEYEAQNQRTFARAYRDHPFIHVPAVITSLSRPRVLVTEWVEGHGFDHVRGLPQDERDRFGEIVFRFCFGSVYHLQHFNADAHPGNYLLMDDGKVAFLDFGMTKQLTKEQIELEIAAIEAVIDEDPDELLDALADLGFLNKPK